MAEMRNCFVLVLIFVDGSFLRYLTNTKLFRERCSKPRFIQYKLLNLFLKQTPIHIVCDLHDVNAPEKH